MNEELMKITIAATPIRDRIPKDLPLADRLSFAMRYARAHANDLFFMSAHVTDDLMLRTSVSAVILAGISEDEQDLIERSLKPLRALSALMSGIDIDIEAFSNSMTPDLIPLLKLWHESENAS